MAIEMIPGINALYNILKRNIDRGNDVLQQRKALAKELHDNCNAWSVALLDTFERIMQGWETDGRQAAMRAIEAQMMDFMKLDYHSLEGRSPVLMFLREDDRFSVFVHACARFYESALGLKRLVYGQIDLAGNSRTRKRSISFEFG